MYIGKGYYCPYISEKVKTGAQITLNKTLINTIQTVAQANEILNRRLEISTLGLLYDWLMIQSHTEASKFSTLYAGNCQCFFSSLSPFYLVLSVLGKHTDQ